MIDQHFLISDINGYHNEPTPGEIEADRQAQVEAARELRRRIYGKELVKVYEPRTQ